MKMYVQKIGTFLEVYRQKTESYSEKHSSETNCDRVIAPNSIMELYKKFVETKIEMFTAKTHKLTNITRSDAVEIHKYLSLRLIFPNDWEKLVESPNLEFSLHDIISMGILAHECTMSTPAFLHRSFAEYFVTLFVFEAVKHGSLQVSKLLSPVLQTIPCQTYVKFYNKKHCVRITDKIQGNSFKNNTFCYFLNDALKQINFSLPNFCVAGQPDQEIFWENVKAACIFHNFSSILNFMERSLPSDFQINTGEDTGTLFLLVKNGDRALLDNLRKQNKSLNVPDFMQNTIIQRKTNISAYEIYPAALAAHFGNWDVFQHLYEMESFEGTDDLIEICLFHCIFDSLDSASPRIAENKIRILNVHREARKVSVWKVIKFIGATSSVKPKIHP